MILNVLKEFFKNCPCLYDEILNVDFVGEKPPYFAIYADNADVVLKKYTTGDTLEQFVFSIRMRAPYGRKVTENVEINSVFEEISDWICLMDSRGTYPDIGKGKSVQRIETISSAHIKNTNAADCVYEMKCRIVYYKRR